MSNPFYYVFLFSLFCLVGWFIKKMILLFWPNKEQVDLLKEIEKKEQGDVNGSRGNSRTGKTNLPGKV